MFGFGKKKSQVKSPAEMTAFERRQSMAMKFEMEERAKSGSDGMPPRPPPATELIGRDIYAQDSPAKVKKGSVKLSSIPPPPPVDRKPADPEFIEFTVVPILLRAKVAYEEANKYGESLKRMSDAELKIVLANASHLIDDVKKCGIKTPPAFEKDVTDDMYWRAGTQGNRKSFVYYRPSDTPEADSGARPKSDSSADPLERTREATRQRASFSGPSLPTLDEADPNRYKVKTRTKAAESLSNDLADLVSSLDKITKKN